MKVYLIRHGKSAANTQGIYNPKDDPLSELGKAQAKEAASYVRSLKVDKVFCSSLLRARQTAELLGVHAEPVVQFADWNVGDFEGKRFGAINDACRQQGLTKDEFKPQGGETLAEFKERVKRYLAGLPDAAYLIISHADVVLEAASFFTRKDWRQLPSPVENVALWVIEDGKLTHYNWKPWKEA